MSTAVLLFASPEEFFAGIFGPRQHDAHLQTRREAIFLAGMRENNKAADARVRAELAKMSAQHRARNRAC